MAHLEAKIIDHRPSPAGRIAGAEIAINIGLGQAGVFQCALGDFSMKLRSGFIGRMPGWMLVDPRDVGLALDGQFGAPLALLVTIPGRFLGLSGGPWQAVKYSVG